MARRRRSQRRKGLTCQVVTIKGRRRRICRRRGRIVTNTPAGKRR